MANPQLFQLAVAQTPAALNGTEERLNWLSKALPQIAGNGADLLLLPELFATGYHLPDALTALAEPADGPIAKAIAALAKQHQIALHYGYPEQADGVEYNAAQCFAPDGALLGHHRKLAIPPGFEADIFAAGQGCQLFTYRGLKIATLICYDAEFPETVRHTASLGADLVLTPTALARNWAWVADTMIPTRAYENGVFLAYANAAGMENGMAHLGHSVIAAPDGQEMVRAGTAPEILTAQIDPARVTAAQKRLPYLDNRGKIRL